MKCAYCGKEAKGTKEHIIYRRIVKAWEKNYLTIYRAK